MRQESKPQGRRSPLSPATAVLFGLLIAGLLVLAFQHWMHVWVWLPYALILVCPLMMLFMMRDMHGSKPS